MTQYTDRTGDDTIHRPDREPEGESGQHLARLCQYHHVLQFVCGVWLSFAVCEAAYSTGSVRRGGRGANGRECKSGSARNDAHRSRENRRRRARDTVSQRHLGCIARARDRHHGKTKQANEIKATGRKIQRLEQFVAKSYSIITLRLSTPLRAHDAPGALQKTFRIRRLRHSAVA